MILALALVAGACSRSDDEGSGSDTASTTSGSGGGASASADFGDLTEVCNSGSPSGSPAQGVSADEIAISTFSDPGFAGRPGLNQELFDTAKVFSEWCNERGGINGRKIVVHERDSALTNVKAKMTEACAEDFMMVGGGAVFDQDGVTTRLECLMPDIAGYAVSPENRGSDLLVQPVPNSVTTIPVGDLRFLEKQFPDGADNYGILTGDIATTRVVGDQYEEAADSLGWNRVYKDVYPAIGVNDWTPYAQALSSAGVEGLIWVGEPENLAKLVVAMNNIGYTPKFIRTDANHYDEKLIDQAGAALKENIFIRSVFFPFEQAKGDTATKQYLDAFAQYLPDGKNRTYLGLQAWSAWLLFAQAAKACGDDVTRKCVYDEAKKITEWTGGGLHATTDPGSGTAPNCFAIEKATPNGFVLADVNANDGIFRCDPNGVYKLKKDYGKGVTLEDVGLTQADLK
jgi:ABC-type branched-subunit amino acid transport system substrate-binding protein